MWSSPKPEPKRVMGYMVALSTAVAVSWGASLQESSPFLVETLYGS